MYPSPFDYYAADSVSEALELLEDLDGEVELLSGGHSLLPTMKTGLAAPDAVIDIGRIDAMTGIEANGDTTTIGANTTYAEIAAHDGLGTAAPTLAQAAGAVGDIQVRNMGTIGGNVAHSDPASDLPGAVLATGATLTAEGPDGERSIAADDFFLGMYFTDLAENELLTAVEVPHLAETDRGAYLKKASPSSGYAMVGVAVVLETDGGTIESARVAANGAFDHATRLDAVEDALAGEPLAAETAEAAGERATDGVETDELMDDLQASSEYRGQLLRVYTRRAIEAAIDGD